MRRIKLYYLFFFSTLKINVPFSVLASLLIVKWDWSIFFEPFPYMLGGLGIVASLLYKEILEKEAYYFYYNSGIPSPALSCGYVPSRQQPVPGCGTASNAPGEAVCRRSDGRSCNTRSRLRQSRAPRWRRPKPQSSGSSALRTAFRRNHKVQTGSTLQLHLAFYRLVEI